MGVLPVVVSKLVSGRLRAPARQFLSMSEKALYSAGLLHPKTLGLPEFLGIGAQKAGNHWLYSNLRCHPQVWLPDEGELHYFDRHFQRTLRFYAEKFVAGAGKIKGDITPSYGILPVERIRFIRRIMPGVRVIFIMRNPIDRAWSQALMMLVSAPNRRFEDVTDQEFYAHFTSPGALRRGDYETILANWLTVFPQEQLLIGFMEDIATRPRDFLARVLKHIGASTQVNWESFPSAQVFYRGPAIPIPDRFRSFLEAIYCPKIESLYKRFGQPVSGWRCSPAAVSPPDLAVVSD